MPLVRLIHDDHVVQQLPTDPWRQLGGIDLVGADLFSGPVVNGQTDHVRLPGLHSTRFLLSRLRHGGLPIVRRTDHDVTAVRSGNRAEHQQQIILDVDANSFRLRIVRLSLPR